jgi:hypothetical protein
MFGGWEFWEPYIGKAIGGNRHHQIRLAIYILPYRSFPRRVSLYSFTLGMATTVFSETLDNDQLTNVLLSWLTPYADEIIACHQFGF